MAEPWDKLPGESDEAYARFLIYRNLGPKRSYRKAYHHYLRIHDGFTGGKERLHLPGQWCSDSSEHFWANRAAAWDVRNLSVYGARMAALHVAAVTRIAEKNARWAARLNPTDAGWSALVASVRVVAEFLPPEVVRGIQERNKPARPAAVPAGSDDDARRAVE